MYAASNGAATPDSAPLSPPPAVLLGRAVVGAGSGGMAARCFVAQARRDASVPSTGRRSSIDCPLSEATAILSTSSGGTLSANMTVMMTDAMGFEPSAPLPPPVSPVSPSRLTMTSAGSILLPVAAMTAFLARFFHASRSAFERSPRLTFSTRSVVATRVLGVVVDAVVDVVVVEVVVVAVAVVEVVPVVVLVEGVVLVVVLVLLLVVVVVAVVVVVVVVVVSVVVVVTVVVVVVVVVAVDVVVVVLVAELASSMPGLGVFLLHSDRDSSLPSEQSAGMVPSQRYCSGMHSST